ncbi:D-2-hydroxyacid dehydrogenase [Lewinella sp. IMCC34191]|uniref:D-2-hydroxyacid dehydrogenase n=1 Tax=Lewinella sp. IMCC34191 TaxID=2259172 RepID=UPI000E2617CC|nr:D-2-hydroxyacid dehydrogenase [Lewinella sp. IMCC34191]
MIYVHLGLPEEEATYLRNQVNDDQLRFGDELAEDERESQCRQAEIILGNPPPAWIRDSSSLRWLQLSSAGFGQYTGWAGQELPFTITNCAEIFGIPVAETALAGVLSLLRFIPTFVTDRQEAKWRGAAVRSQLGTLTGKRVLILGPGSIGGSFRKLLAGFNCRVETMGNRSRADFYTLGELDDRLPEADVVMAALPDTEVTKGMFDAARIQRMSSTCIFVNVGRGSLVDEAALIERLRADELGGAVLDVTRHEPLPPGDPLWQAPRTILTQHSGGGAQDEHRRIVDRFLDNLEHFKAGRELDYQVDLARGY